jgi:hypothetical protein
MSIISRMLNRFRETSLDRDLRDEVEFQLHMRAGQHQRSGLDSEEAMKRARDQFGDVDAFTKGMRRARLTSIATLVTVSSLLAVLIVVWISQNRRSSDASIPTLPAAPVLIGIHNLHAARQSPPPPPPPPPTREECLEQAKRVPRICQ